MLDANLYRNAVQTALSGADPIDIPPIECTDMMLDAIQIVHAESSTLPLLACMWRRESLWYQHPVSNPRTDGGADCGPIQLATTYWNKSPWIDGLDNPFGTTRSKTESFDGQPFDNLCVGVRALASLVKRADGDLAVAAGLFRAGHIDETPNSAYMIRKAEFEGIADRYAGFFESLKGS